MEASPTFFREGKPWFAWGVNRPILGEHFEAFERLCGAGLRHIHCEATCTEDIYHPELRFWHGSGIYDGSFQDRYFSKLARICDEALFHLRLYVGARIGGSTPIPMSARSITTEVTPGKSRVAECGASRRSRPTCGARKPAGPCITISAGS